MSQLNSDLIKRLEAVEQKLEAMEKRLDILDDRIFKVNMRGVTNNNVTLNVALVIISAAIAGAVAWSY